MGDPVIVATIIKAHQRGSDEEGREAQSLSAKPLERNHLLQLGCSDVASEINEVVNISSVSRLTAKSQSLRRLGCF